MLGFVRRRRVGAAALAAALASWACEPPNAQLDDVVAVPPTTKRVARPVDEAAEGQSKDLLQHYVGRERITAGEAERWELPFQGKRLVVALLISVAKDEPADLRLVLTPDARFGPVDTRRLAARPIFADGGVEFMNRFREAARRFPGTASWQNLIEVPGVQETVRTGAEPVWSYYENGNDRILFRSIIYQGRARIDYVGFADEPPEQAPPLVGPERPPLLPPYRRPDGKIALPPLPEKAQRQTPGGPLVTGG
jgi:hypothetical protein